MATTTRKKKNTTSQRKGSGTRSRGKKGGSSGKWMVYSLLFAVVCGGGYYFYENGLPFELPQVKWESSEEVAAIPHAKSKEQPVAPKNEPREAPKVVKENSVVAQPVAKKEVERKTVAQPPKKETSKSVEPAEKSKSVEPAETSKSVEPAETRMSVEPAEKSKSVEPAETSKFVAPSYKKYHQGRWGYTVVYPSFLTQEIRSANDDGCHFADYEGTEFITYGSWNVTEASINELYREKLDDHLKVTYKRLYKEEKYFIKFGYTKDGRMFYMKQVIADKLKEAPIITGILYFRPESKKGSEAVIKKIFDGFPY